MTNDDRETLRNIAWSEMFPWLKLARCFRIALQFRLLFLSAVGLFLMLGGWSLLGELFMGNSLVGGQMEAGTACPWLAVTDAIPDRPGFLGVLPQRPRAMPPITERGARPSARMPDILGDARPSILKREFSDPVFGSWEHLSRPFVEVFSWRTATRTETGEPVQTGWMGWVAFLVLCGLWAVAVWAFFGGAVSRAAAVELATGDRAKLVRSLRYAASKWHSYFAAPLIPLVGTFFLSAILAVVGWIFLSGGAGFMIFLGALGWPLLLLAGFLMALLLLGLVFGWPLFWSNLSTEGVDSFDAVGRTYDYVYHRPLNYLFYVVVAAVLGVLGWLVVSNFFAGIVAATYWAASWGGGEEQVLAIATTGQDLGSLGKAGAAVVRFWVQCVKLLGVGFLYSYFWAAGAGIYLLLRRDVDATEMDEVLPEEEIEQPPTPLPEVKTDSAGAPVVAEQPQGNGGGQEEGTPPGSSQES